MSQIKVGHFEADGGLIYLPIGFIPDYFEMTAKGASSTNAIVYKWFRELEDHDSIDGWSFTDGTDAEITAGSGIAAYDSGSELPSISDWSATASKTARSATAPGSYVKGTTSGTNADGQDVDREAIFECVAGATTGSTEPTWPVEIGENSALDGDVIWQLVDTPKFRAGYQGVRLAASMTGLANGNEGYYIAIQADSSEDHGDVDSWASGIYT